jgi:hypothetical protein
MELFYDIMFWADTALSIAGHLLLVVCCCVWLKVRNRPVQIRGQGKR